jgi:hypothetical protein
MGCGFSLPSETLPENRSAYRVASAADESRANSPTVAQPPPTSCAPPGCVRGPASCDDEPQSPILSTNAVGALDDRPSKRARIGKHRVRQWVEEAHLIDLDASPLADSDLPTPMASSASSPDNDGLGVHPRRLSHLALIRHNLRMAEASHTDTDDDANTW